MVLAIASISFVSIGLHWYRSNLSESLLHAMRISCIVAGLLAMCLGAGLLHHMRRDRNPRGWIAVLGLVLGLTGVVGAGALPPQAAARTVRCMSCLRKIGIAMQAYASQHSGQPPANLQSLNLPFQHDASDFTCPITGERRTVIVPSGILPLGEDSFLLVEPRPADGGQNVILHDRTAMFLRYGDRFAPRK